MKEEGTGNGEKGVERRGGVYIILRTAMTLRAAAAVEIALLSGTRAAHASLSVTADVDVGNRGCVWVGCGSAFRACAGIGL